MQELADTIFPEFALKRKQLEGLCAMAFEGGELAKVKGTHRWQEINLNECAKLFPCNLVDSKDQIKWLKKMHELFRCDYSYGGYLEDRSTLWNGHYHNPNSMIHLGVDFNVPQGTDIHMPYDGICSFVSHSPDQVGGWGGRIDFYNQERDFYFILGHLSLNSELHKHVVMPPEPPFTLKKGSKVGYIGSSDENGGWAPHLHLQLMSKATYESFSFRQEIDGYGMRHHEMQTRYPNPLHYR